MRQLIETRFKDNTSYSAQAGADVGAVVIDHYTGPVGQMLSLDFDNFKRYFPITKGQKLTPSYLAAYTAYQAGISPIEVVRLQGKNKFFNIRISEAGEATAAWEEKRELNDSLIVVGLKYAGNVPEVYEKSLQVTLSVADSEDIPGQKQLKVALESVTGEGDKKQIEIIESVEGVLQAGASIDGMNFDVVQLLNNSDYFYCEADYSVDAFADTAQASYAVEKQTIEEIESSDICSAYSKYFKSIETTLDTILIDPGSKTQTEANEIIALAEYRQNCTALVGYPVASAFTPEAIKEYKAGLANSMFAAFYAIRQVIQINGIKYVINGIGTTAGDYAQVANTESINQLPSAKTFGNFGGSLSETLDFDEVLDITKAGANTCYEAPTGARLFGLRSLYAREMSYFAKFNVGRVIARILQYAFNVAIDAIHTGNTDNRKIATQVNLNADLDRLKAQNAIRMQSSVICNESNNKDVDTNGGEILQIDYELWLIKLIERVRISITATDSSVSATISQG